MAGIYDVYQIPEVRKDNPLQTHFDQNQLLKEAVATGKITPEQYNILGGYDVQKNLTPGNPILGGIVNLGASIPYNIYQSIKTDQPFSDVFGDVYRNVKGGLGLFSPELKTAYNDIMAGKTPQNVTQLANKNFIDTIGNMVFTTANADAIPTEIEKQSVERGVQDFDLESVRDIISQMEEEKSNYIERPENRFNMDGIMQNLKNYGKDAAGRYAASQFLGGAGNMIGGPTIGGIAAIAGLLGGGNLFNQPYMGAEGYTMDRYGNMYTAGQLNKMNALGGYYTEQARDSRRRDQEIKNMIERKNQGLRYGINRLAQLQKEKEKEEAARRTSGGNYLTGGGGDTFSFSDNSGYGGTGTASPSNVGAGGRLGGGV